MIDALEYGTATRAFFYFVALNVKRQGWSEIQHVPCWRFVGTKESRRRGDTNTTLRQRRHTCTSFCHHSIFSFVKTDSSAKKIKDFQQDIIGEHVD
jgi:hypothetical protein